jgi:hypothetical protein
MSRAAQCNNAGERAHTPAVHNRTTEGANGRHRSCWSGAWCLPSPRTTRSGCCCCLSLPCLWLCMRAKLTGQAYDAKHTATVSSPSLRPPSPSFPLSLSSLSCRCHHHHHHHRPDLSVSGYCSHPTRSFPPVVAHSPTSHPPRPPTRGALYLLPWTTDKQADGRTRS